MQYSMVPNWNKAVLFSSLSMYVNPNGTVFLRDEKTEHSACGECFDDALRRLFDKMREVEENERANAEREEKQSIIRKFFEARRVLKDV